MSSSPPATGRPLQRPGTRSSNLGHCGAQRDPKAGEQLLDKPLRRRAGILVQHRVRLWPLGKVVQGHENEAVAGVSDGQRAQDVDPTRSMGAIAAALPEVFHALIVSAEGGSASSVAGAAGDGGTWLVVAVELAVGPGSGAGLSVAAELVAGLGRCRCGKAGLSVLLVFRRRCQAQGLAAVHLL